MTGKVGCAGKAGVCVCVCVRACLCVCGGGEGGWVGGRARACLMGFADCVWARALALGAGAPDPYAAAQPIKKFFATCSQGQAPPQPLVYSLSFTAWRGRRNRLCAAAQFSDLFPQNKRLHSFSGPCMNSRRGRRTASARACGAARFAPDNKRLHRLSFTASRVRLPVGGRGRRTRPACGSALLRFCALK